MNPFLNRKPVLDPAAFVGRDDQLRAVGALLAAEPPQCCSVVGEARSGKTSLLYALASGGAAGEAPRVFAYVNAGPYADLGDQREHGALFFWRDLAKAIGRALGSPAAPDDVAVPEGELIDAVYVLRGAVERLLLDASGRRVAVLIDNVEGVAQLPPYAGRLLRSLVQDPALAGRVAYVVTSRRPVDELVPPAARQEPSSFAGLFGQPVLLGPLREDEARRLIGGGDARALGEADAALVLRVAGRHPALITIACAEIYEQRRAGARALTEAELLRRVLPEASAVLEQWWSGLARRVPHGQAVLAALAGNRQAPEAPAAFAELERHGLVERDGQRHRVGCELLRMFVLQRQPDRAEAPAERLVEGGGSPTFTHLEHEVYRFLEAHAGTVCDREAIKRAVWAGELPTDSALQKIIERIRDKIEPDPKNPRRLLAVRGQGYILRPPD